MDNPTYSGPVIYLGLLSGGESTFDCAYSGINFAANECFSLHRCIFLM
jgi:hypothetical protein